MRFNDGNTRDFFTSSLGNVTHSRQRRTGLQRDIAEFVHARRCQALRRGPQMFGLRRGQIIREGNGGNEGPPVAACTAAYPNGVAKFVQS